jgi:hypothetical protein
MAGRFTRRMYDGCAFKQDTRQSTEPLDYQLDVTKYVNCNNMCAPKVVNPGAVGLVDVESSLWGLDKLSSKCDSMQHPFCGPAGCLLTKDSRVPFNRNPLACERGLTCEPYNAVIKSNMCPSTSSGITIPSTRICPTQQANGYYAKSNAFYSNSGVNGAARAMPPMRNQQMRQVKPAPVGTQPQY